MNDREQKIYSLALEVIHQKLTIVEFSTLASKSYRQSQRIVKAIRDEGMIGIKHGNSGRIPINKTSIDIEKDILQLLKNDYYDFNLTHFRETIAHKEGIIIGKKVVYRIARTNGLIKRPKRRSAKNIHKPRARMPAEGMLVQFDGSVHPWFGEIISDLIGGIDDATSEVVGAEFFIGETSLHCMQVMMDITKSKGLPDAYYLDGAGYFGKHDRQTETQIGRALESLGVNTIIAGSAQAKGRIERLWNTFQDRLVAELRFCQITNIADANKFLKEDFLPRFNEKFSVPPRESQSRYRKIEENLELDFVFCIKNRRKISGAHTFSWEGNYYVIDEDRDYRFRTININNHIDGSTSFDIMGRKVKVIDSPLRKNDHDKILMAA